jgi:hypothetical protein
VRPEDLFETEGEETPVRWFVATYTSHCECGEIICPGDRAGYIDEDTEASCAECCQHA